MKLSDLRQARASAIDKLNRDETIADGKVFDALEAEIRELEAQIARAEAAQARSASLARPSDASDPVDDPVAVDADWPPRARHLGAAAAAGDGSYRGMLGAADQQFSRYLSRARSQLGFVPDRAKHFRSFGDQLQAVYSASMARRTGGAIDERLVRAPTGAGEVDPTGGGFLIQTDFSTAIFMLAHDMGEILSRVNKIPISANANSLKIPGVDETSRVTGSRWGGVQSYWAGEGSGVTATKPKFRLIEFDLKKLMSIMYMTDELLQDSTALTAIAGQAFSEEIMFMTEDAILEGTGAGVPLGLLNSTALVSVAKETGQAAATIVRENLDKMWMRCWSRARKNAAWFINQDVEPQLNQLNQAVGLGGQLVYMPPGGLSGAPYATLYGRPIVTTEYNPTLGTQGDILLADLSQYTLIDKGGVQAATSMHVAFLTDEMVFRITYRVDGRPMWTVPITPFKGTNTHSPFVALANR